MRKRLKGKKRCCAACKPHKRGWANRWKPKEAARLRLWEREHLLDTWVIGKHITWTETEM